MSHKVKKKRYYIQGATVAIEEDATHEFKGHCNLSVEEIPPWAREQKNERATRRAVSRVLNAFLNTGKGGTVYLGVSDDGTVHGLKLTLYQKDHVEGNLEDLFSRYNPKVPPHRYKLKFIPVLAESSTEEDAYKLISQSDHDSCDTSQRSRPHIYRTHTYCWCDKDATAQLNMGILAADYVIEITIKPWDLEDPRNTDSVGTLIKLNPLHEDEEGKVNMRRQASVVKYTLNEIAQLSRQQVKEACEAEIRRLKFDVSHLQDELNSKGQGHVTDVT